MKKIIEYLPLLTFFSTIIVAIINTIIIYFTKIKLQYFGIYTNLDLNLNISVIICEILFVSIIFILIMFFAKRICDLKILKIHNNKSIKFKNIYNSNIYTISKKQTNIKDKKIIKNYYIELVKRNIFLIAFILLILCMIFKFTFLWNDLIFIVIFSIIISFISVSFYKQIVSELISDFNFLYKNKVYKNITVVMLLITIIVVVIIIMFGYAYFVEFNINRYKTYNYISIEGEIKAIIYEENNKLYVLDTNYTLKDFKNTKNKIVLYKNKYKIINKDNITIYYKQFKKVDIVNINKD